MSRWASAFAKHPFRIVWSALKAAVRASQVDDKTIETAVSELARLKKVIAYIDGLIDAMDPELVPLSLWNSFSEQATECLAQVEAFGVDRDIARIQQANAHADNLLTYVRPYMVASGRTAKSLRDAATAYADAFSENISNFKTKAKSLLEGIETDKTAAEGIRETIEAAQTAISAVAVELIGTDEKPGTIDSLRAEIEDVKEKSAEINDLYNEAIAGGDEISTREAVRSAAKEIGDSKIAVDGLIQKATSSVADLREFHARVFGVVAKDGTKSGGLELELETHKRRLVDFEAEQKTRYAALNGQIEGLLPGATSAGLATAYREMKDSFEKPIKDANRLFMIAIAALLVVSGFLAIQKLDATGLTLVEFGTWDAVLRGLLNKLPFYGPVVWLAYYATKRRSENQRLQQEYAHKEAIAKSFDSYKKQIDDLGLDESALLKDLLQKAVNAIAQNPSLTLDGKHGDKAPLQEIAEKAIQSVLDSEVGRLKLRSLVGGADL